MKNDIFFFLSLSNKRRKFTILTIIDELFCFSLILTLKFDPSFKKI